MNYKAQRIDATVTVTVDGFGESSPSAAVLTLTALPAAYRPASSVFTTVVVDDNSTLSTGRVEIDASGVITVGNDLAGAAFSGVGTMGTNPLTVSYVL